MVQVKKNAIYNTTPAQKRSHPIFPEQGFVCLRNSNGELIRDESACTNQNNQRDSLCEWDNVDKICRSKTSTSDVVTFYDFFDTSDDGTKSIKNISSLPDWVRLDNSNNPIFDSSIDCGYINMIANESQDGLCQECPANTAFVLEKDERGNPLLDQNGKIYGKCVNEVKCSSLQNTENINTNPESSSPTDNTNEWINQHLKNKCSCEDMAISKKGKIDIVDADPGASTNISWTAPNCDHILSMYT